MTMDAVSPLPGARSARLAHLRKFVCQPPDRGVVLRLVTCEDPPLVIGEWMRAACEDQVSTAEEVDMRLREHAQTQGAEVTANLVWQTDEAGLVTSKRLKCKPEQNELDPAQAEALGLVGTEAGDRLQRQRHYEAMMRMWVATSHQQQQLMLETLRERERMHTEQMRVANEQTKLLAKMLDDTLRHAHSAHLELDKLRAQQRRELDLSAERLREMRDQEPDRDPEKEAKASFVRQVSEGIGQAVPVVLEMAMQKLCGFEDAPSNESEPTPAPSPKPAA